MDGSRNLPVTGGSPIRLYAGFGRHQQRMPGRPARSLGLDTEATGEVSKYNVDASISSEDIFRNGACERSMIKYDKFRLSLKRLEEQFANYQRGNPTHSELDREAVAESVIRRFKMC